MNFKRFAIIALTLCLMLCLCACGGDSNDTANSTAASKSEGNTVTKPTAAPTETTPADTRVTYTVKVLDPDGNPVEGVKVQLCAGELCRPPVATDAQGIAAVTCDENVYDIKVSDLPENMQEPVYTGSFGQGEYEATVTLRYKVFNYEILVTDEGGNPVSSVRIQLLTQKGSEGLTDENGKLVGNSLDLAAGIKVTQVPEGYAEDATEYPLTYNAEKDVYEASIVLKAVA